MEIYTCFQPAFPEQPSHLSTVILHTSYKSSLNIANTYKRRRQEKGQSLMAIDLTKIYNRISSPLHWTANLSHKKDGLLFHPLFAYPLPLLLECFLHKYRAKSYKVNILTLKRTIRTDFATSFSTGAYSSFSQKDRSP
jgi:hypothetical protein